MAENTTQELKQRREALWESLPALTQNRADTYRLNSDALALGRAGVTHQTPQDLARLSTAETTADDAMRHVQREIRQLDQQIGSTPSGGFGSRVGRAVRRTRAER
jgi:hypothetical protein